jgi:hypothetical protein
MVKGKLADFVAEQRALYAAEERLGLAERDLFACTKDSGKTAAARFNYQQALRAAELARTRLEKRKCNMAGRRHLRLVVT